MARGRNPRRRKVSSLRRKLNAVPYLPSDYDEQLMRYIDAHRGRFQIPAPAGPWEVYLEYPGYLAWVPADGSAYDYIAAGIGWEEPHLVPFQIEEVESEVDLGAKLTGDLERDAAMYRETIQNLMAQHRDTITDLFGAAWVPATFVSAKRHTWGIPAR